MFKLKILQTLFLLTIFSFLSAQAPWKPITYPDESGFVVRMAPMLQRITDKGFGHRSLSRSTCPDTGLPVQTWALEGETIFSPYTGRAYQQGSVGYFGVLERNEKGEIVRFGGDPLKSELTPATASLLLNARDQNAKAFLSIPGNLRQQYHFAAKNWGRFYPLLGDAMGEDWKREFYSWIATYSETRRPSDGHREHDPLSTPHNLVGEPGYLLGGNPINGGTENHKVMWRTTGLLYSQLFPDTTYISFREAPEAEMLIKEMLRDFFQRLLFTGNGEYDSQVYYPHSIEPIMNIYDFSPDEETRLLARFALDYYFVTFGLKVMDGNIAGAQKRGYLPGASVSEMETMLWSFFNNTSRDMSEAVASLHQVTTQYRPNKIIYDIVNKNVPLPFEAKMARPFYHMNYPFSFAETFFCSDNFAIGSVQMTIIDNPNQQMIWSMIANGTDGPLAFSGGHPMRQSTSGHSPYTQVFQSKGTMMVATAQTNTVENVEAFIDEEYQRRSSHSPNIMQSEGIRREITTRQRTATDRLKDFRPPTEETPDAYNEFWDNSREMNTSWFFYPNTLKPIYKNGHWLLEANEVFIAVIPLSDNVSVIAPDPHLAEQLDSRARSFFNVYSILAFQDDLSGYIVETGEKATYGTLENFSRYVMENTQTQRNQLEIVHQSLDGDTLRMNYFPEGLRPLAHINDKFMDWDNFTDGAVYLSPYVTVKDGFMHIGNGTDSYTIDFTGNLPVFLEE